MTKLLAFLLLLLVVQSTSSSVEPSQGSKAFFRSKTEEQQLENTEKTGRNPFLSKKNNAKNNKGRESLLQELQSMIYLSSLIYAFATVRQTIREGGIATSSWPGAERVQLENSDIIENTDLDCERIGCLQHALTGKDLDQFLTPANMERFANNKDMADPLNLKAIQGMRELGDDWILWEFDDRIGDDRELVYAITINRVTKRVTIIFRGSVSVQDWLTNLTLGPKKLELPSSLQQLKRIEISETNPIAVHWGFADYLDQSFDHILDNLKAIYKKYPTYNLFVTGHSLGGALSTLLSYRLAGCNAKKGCLHIPLPQSEGSKDNKNDSLRIPLPVTCITYAAPLVGNPSFRNAFHALECLGRLRHVRVTNEFDIIPLSPPMSGYQQTGVNIHLLENGDCEVCYSFNLRSFSSQFNSWRSPAAHSLVNYWESGRAGLDKYLDKPDALHTLSDLYAREASAEFLQQ